MLQYIEANILYVSNFMHEHIPAIKVLKPDASFLVWLDCRDLHLSQNELEKLFIEKAHLALNSGTLFGSEGEGFMRMNVGTARSVIIKALNNLKKAVNG
jgi:cystathionine beta-lyase